MTEFAQDTVKPNADNPTAPRILHWLPAAFLLTVVAVGAIATLTSPGFREAQPDKTVINGEWMLSWEKNLDSKVPWRTPSVNLWGGLNYRLFGEAQDGALIGQYGWLFTNEEFQTASTDAAEFQSKIAYVKQVRDQLAKDGAKLVVALIPAKVRIYPQEVGRAGVPASHDTLYADFRDRLEDADIAAPDLAAALKAARSQGNVFLRTDTHWTPLGAEIAARAVAETVQELNLELPPADYSLTHKPDVARAGDLLRYVPVPEDVGPELDRVSEPEYTRTDEGGGGLLGDESIAVTLVGTSYSADSKDNVWHFDDALAAALGTEVLNAAQEGKGPIVPMREYLKSQDRKDNPPQVVVWEIPERFLRVVYDAE
ncbi:alginate O-acetyltransferase AlgX-related protein [Deinococcus humi]|uniref:Alginate O-acetyltransferase complex protein AlgJ n=1 Tax=Deinococcus humi TaxID=662880 RepID=A0A7W8JVG7_9DEIO|nr:hypothetical protein [Deinococcus humi]MBB5363987.1 alginate O-acetyltransferase complex protein AlgJ [Deinococcus humi]